MLLRNLGRTAGVGATLLALGCLPDNPDPLVADTGDASSGGSDDGSISDGGAVLGCPGGTCTLVMVAQTLDDRIEIFAPDDPDGVVYRGAIDVDLKPNECAGCGLGDYGGDRLDEPFGVALAGGALHIIAGHYPTPELGTLLSFPIETFADRMAGGRLEASEYFSGGVFGGDVVSTPLNELEPTFMTAIGSRLVIGTFNNNLFGAEDTWTAPGKLLVLDAADPLGGGIGVADLGSLDGGGCNAAAQVIEIAPGRLAVACDGNEAVAVLDASSLADGSTADAAASLSGTLCNIPGATSNRRVRYLAPDGDGGFLVGEGPVPLDLLSAARLWHFDADCGMQGLATFGANGDGQLGEILRVPGSSGTWLAAVGAANSMSDARGLYIVRQETDLEVCGPIAGLESFLSDTAGDPLEPFAIALNPAGDRVAVGAGPLVAPGAGPSFGKVLWGSLTVPDDACTASVTITDLTAGGDGAPAVDPNDASTFRRAPNVVEIVEVAG